VAIPHSYAPRFTFMRWPGMWAKHWALAAVFSSKHWTTANPFAKAATIDIPLVARHFLYITMQAWRSCLKPGIPGTNLLRRRGTNHPVEFPVAHAGSGRSRPASPARIPSVLEARLNSRP